MQSFSQEDLLLILSINAGKEFWSELGGLCDISGLIRISPRMDWERVVREAEVPESAACFLSVSGSRTNCSEQASLKR